MKACGKSTVGKLLAKRLDVNFIELDQEIEKDYLMEKTHLRPLRGLRWARKN